MRPRTIALIQMDIAEGLPEINREHAGKLIVAAAQQGAEMVILPELWTTGYIGDRLGQLAEPVNGDTMQYIAAIARQWRLWVVAGSLPIITERGLNNTAVIFNAEGQVAGMYAKAHLFPLGIEEDRYFIAGDQCCLVDWDGFQLGILLCYDLRFPELARSLVLQGAQGLLIPAQWPAVRQRHWQILSTARAIENQVYVMAVNRVGRGAGMDYAGGSMVIDPWGEVIAQGSAAETTVWAQLEPEQVAVVRRQLPCLDRRKPNVYK